MTAPTWSFAAPDTSGLLSSLGYMDNAIETATRHLDGGYTCISGRVNLTYVTAYRNQPVTQLGTICRGTAVAGLTAARWGIYTVDASGNLTLVARTAQQTSGVYTSTFSEYVFPLDTTGGFPASWTFTKGTRYAFGTIVTFTTTAPQIKGTATNSALNALVRPPRICASLTVQTDLPTSIAVGSLGTDGNAVYQFALA